MAHNNQVIDEDEPEYREPVKRSSVACEKCLDTGYISRVDIAQSGPFAGVRYERSRLCDCKLKN